MTYRIGVGILLQGKSFNAVRDSQLASAKASGNLHGLRQPPHITVKRPFTVTRFEDIAAFSDQVTAIASEATQFTVDLEGIDSFGEHAIYIDVRATSKLTSLHRKLQAAADRFSDGASDAFEGLNMRFHVTLAMGLSETEYKNSSTALANREIGINSLEASTLGLFFSEDDTNWVIIHEMPLSA